MNKNLVRSLLFWPPLFICQLLATALLSWHLLAQVNFAYPLGYKLLQLDKHIAEFAPLNRYKQGFEYTTAKDHWRLFGEICSAIQHSGAGLQKISYTLPNGQSTPLMHESEIVHLQDVSHLIYGFYWVGSLAALMWFALLLLAKRRAWSLPSSNKILLGFGIGLVAITGLILSLGAKQVFYWAHTQIFPEGHQWFFYYQDSLMTTLMKAPDIFAFIATLLLLLLIAFWLLGFWAMNRILEAKPEQAPKHKNKTR